MASYVFVAILVTAFLPLTAFYFFVLSFSNANVELSRDKAEIIVKAIEGHVRQYLDVVPLQTERLADLLDRESVVFDDRKKIEDLFTATLGATPQVATLSWATYEGRIVRVFRNRPDERIKVGDWSDELAFTEMLKLFEGGAEPSWDGIFFAETVNRPFINYVLPLRNGARGARGAFSRQNQIMIQVNAEGRRCALQMVCAGKPEAERSGGERRGTMACSP